MIKFDTVLDDLSETYIASEYFTKPRMTLICCAKRNFFLTVPAMSFPRFLEVFPDMISVVKYIKQLHLLFRAELLFRLQGFSTKGKISLMMSGTSSFFN